MSSSWHATQLAGWARTKQSSCLVVRPATVAEVGSVISEAKNRGLTVGIRGGGLSYGDQIQNRDNAVIDMRALNRILSWNKESGVMTVEAGATYDSILRLSLPDRWILPAVPGTRYPTMGGALANNVHGKNAYRLPTIGSAVLSFELVAANSDILVCSRTEHTDLFFAAIGGSGLLGVIVRITFQLVRIPSAHLATRTVAAPSLRHLLDELDKAAETADFALAQVDCFARGVSLGRGMLSYSRWEEALAEKPAIMRPVSARVAGIKKTTIAKALAWVFNDSIVRFFVAWKYRQAQRAEGAAHVLDFFAATFLLDHLPKLSLIYRHGFFELQPLIPKEEAYDCIRALIERSQAYGMPGHLSAIKRHRPDRNPFLFCYSLDGYSFAMDIPRRPGQEIRQGQMFRELLDIVHRHRGRVFFAKDVHMTAADMRAMYPRWEEFMRLKKHWDPDTLFQSDMYRRLFVPGDQPTPRTDISSSGGTDFFDYDLYHAWKCGNFFERFFHRRRIAEVSSLLTKMAPAAILDYGCNTGTFVIALSALGYQIAGFDISPANIERARSYGAAADRQLEWFLQDLPDRRWDCILLTNVLEYVIDKQSVMDEVVRHLAPGGTVVATLANPGHPYIRFAGLRQLLSNRDKADIVQAEPKDKLRVRELLRLFHEQGFVCQKRKYGLGWVNTHFVFKQHPPCF